MSGTFMNFQCLGSKERDKERSIQAVDLDQEVTKIFQKASRRKKYVYSRVARQRTNLHFLTFRLPKRYPLIVALLLRLQSWFASSLSPLSIRECVNVAWIWLTLALFARDNGCSQWALQNSRTLLLETPARERWVIGLISGLTVSIFCSYAVCLLAPVWSDSRRFSSWL